jgi:hypothetical protein
LQLEPYGCCRFHKDSNGDAGEMSKPPLMKTAKKSRAPAPDDEFLTTEEAAKRLKRSAKTLEYWRS